MTGVGRPFNRAYRVSGGDAEYEADPAMGNGAKSRNISKDSLIALGTPTLADILMRASLKYPDLAEELAACKPPQRTDDPSVRHHRRFFNHLLQRCLELDCVERLDPFLGHADEPADVFA